MAVFLRLDLRNSDSANEPSTPQRLSPTNNRRTSSSSTTHLLNASWRVCLGETPTVSEFASTLSPATVHLRPARLRERFNTLLSKRLHCQPKVGAEADEEASSGRVAMACLITLPFWPNSVDCMSWSRSNLMAVCGGENVAILSPRHKERGRDGSYWNTTVFAANAFTSREIARLTPLSLANFSVGEELSTWQVQSLEWSCPGIARYGGCVLAVLTSNHVLSIWDCDGKPEVVSNWKRILALNGAIRTYYEDRTPEFAKLESTIRRQDVIQAQQRVRAFAWSRLLQNECPGKDRSSTRAGCTKSHLLAIATEGGDVLIMRLQSPYDILDAGTQDWRCTVVCSFRAVSDEGAHDSDILVADHFAWQSWACNDSGQVTTLSYLSSGRLFHRRIQCTSVSRWEMSISAGELRSLEVGASHQSLDGLLRYTGKRETVLVSPSAIVCNTTISAAIDESTSTYCLDGRWDSISGAAVRVVQSFFIQP